MLAQREERKGDSMSHRGKREKEIACRSEGKEKRSLTWSHKNHSEYLYPTPLTE